MKAPSLALFTGLLCAMLGGTSQPGFSQVVDNSAPLPLAATAPTPVPALVPYAGIAVSPDGKAITDPVSITFLIYKDLQGGEPLWYETETVTPNAAGKFSVQLGSTLPSGLPADLFLKGEARWLELQIAGQTPRARTLLTSVPYAFKSVDADTLGGQAAGNFVTQEQLAARFRSTAAALAEQAMQPLVAGTVTGAGTAGYVPLWTGAATLGNSVFTQVGAAANAKVGIKTTNPATSLDVNGSETLRGYLNMLPGSAATATAGVYSPLLELSASSFLAGGAATQKTFAWQVQPTGNNTKAPSADLRLLYSSAGGAFAATGFSIASNGVITFAPAQTIPGIIKSIAATSPVTATTASGAVSLGLNTSALETTLNSVYPRLGAYNTFASGATFGGETTLNGSSTDWMMVVTNQSTQSKGTLLAQAVGNMLGIEGASPGGSAIVGATTTGVGLTAETYGEGKAAYLWSQADSTPNTQIVSAGQGDGLQIATHNGNALTSTSLNGYGGLFSNNSTYQATVYASNAGAGNAGYFGNNSAGRVALAGVNASTDPNAIATYGSVVNGKGVYGISTAGTGIYGVSSSGTAVSAVSDSGTGLSVSSNSGTGLSASSSSGIALEVVAGGHLGVFSHRSGYSSQASRVGGLPAVWGDMPGGGLSIAVAGTTDDGVAGLFLNNSAGNTTLSVSNASTGGTRNFFRTFMATTPDGVCGIGGGGDLSCTGQLKSLVDAGGGARKVETYAVQSPENWMEDFGSGVLERGVAVVGIDPTFAETVSESADYHVFLTPNGDSKGLYVIRKTATSFEVRESGGGISSLAFDYRIVAKRRGFEAQRHVDVTEDYRAAMERAVLKRKPAQGGEPVLPAPRIVSPQTEAPAVQRPQSQTSPQITPSPAAERKLQTPPRFTAAK